MNEDEPDEPWYFENRQRKIAFDESKVRDFLSRISRDLATGVEFSVVVSSDEAVRKANRRFRNESRTTDVLSFPDGEDGYLGDLLIAASRAARQARDHGHSVEEEINSLALHGILHLNGYDHESDRGEMSGEEERLRARYGLKSGLIARARS